MPVSDLDILKKLLFEEETETLRLSFEEDPMGFILNKYPGLNNVLEYMLTKDFREYLSAVFIVAPKPTTFKVVLHNGQYFFLQFMGKTYQATVLGKNYYLMTVGEKERCMIAIARLLRYGVPLKTKGPEGGEEAGGLGGDTTSPPAETSEPSGETGGEEGGGEALEEAALLKHLLLREAKSEGGLENMDATQFEAFAAAMLSDLDNGKITNPKKEINGVQKKYGQTIFNSLLKDKKIPRGDYKQVDENYPVSEKWREWAEKQKSDKAKTDIEGAALISLKKGGSQLMSPEYKELIATVNAAIEHAGVAIELETQIAQDVSELSAKVKEAKDALDLSARELKDQLSQGFLKGGEFKTQQGFATGAIRSLGAGGEEAEKEAQRINRARKEKKGSESGLPQIRKVKGEYLNQHNKMLYDLLIETDERHLAIEEKIKSLVDSNPQFYRGLVYEAGCGDIKFGNSSKGRAKYMLAVSNDVTRYKFMSIDKMQDEGVSYLMNHIDFNCEYKSNKITGDKEVKDSRGKKGKLKLGYSIYSTIRLNISDLADETKKEDTKLQESIDNYLSDKQLLTEGVIDWITDKLKAFGNWLKKKFDDLIQFIKSVYEAAMKLIKRGFDKLCAVVGGEIEVSVSNDGRLSDLTFDEGPSEEPKEEPSEPSRNT